jgi:hypothetical protein
MCSRGYIRPANAPCRWHRTTPLRKGVGGDQSRDEGRSDQLGEEQTALWGCGWACARLRRHPSHDGENQPPADDVGWAGQLGRETCLVGLRSRRHDGGMGTCSRAASISPTRQDAVEQHAEKAVGGCDGITATGEFLRSFDLDYRCVRAAMDWLPCPLTQSKRPLHYNGFDQRECVLCSVLGTFILAEGRAWPGSHPATPINRESPRTALG